jgi:hypothetical protein
MAEKGAEAHDKATLNFLPFAWISLGKQRVHATTKTSETSSVVQIPMNRPFQDTSASAIGADMAKVNQMRMAEAIHALCPLSALGPSSTSHSTYISPVANSSVMNILRASGTFNCHSDKVGRNKMTTSEAILKAP